MGISQDNWHKPHNTEGQGKPLPQEVKIGAGMPCSQHWHWFPLQTHSWWVGRQEEVGNVSWSSECCRCKTRIIDVICNASNDKLVHAKTLVKNCIGLIDSTLYRHWCKSHYALPLGHKKRALTPEEEEIFKQKMMKENSSYSFKNKYDERKKMPKL